MDALPPPMANTFTGGHLKTSCPLFQTFYLSCVMTSLRRVESFQSTESFGSDDEVWDDEPPSHTHVPKDLYYEDQESGERLLVAKEGETLPINQTKYKKKSGWTYAYKFRFVYCLTLDFKVIKKNLWRS